MPPTDETAGQANDPLAVPCPSCGAEAGDPCRRIAPGRAGSAPQLEATAQRPQDKHGYHFARLPFTVDACTSCGQVFRSQALAHNGQCDQCRGHALALATDL